MELNSPFFANVHTHRGENAICSDEMKDTKNKEQSVLARLTQHKRKRNSGRKPAIREVGLGEEAEKNTYTEMEKQVVALQRAHPDMLLLFQCGYRMRIFGQDAENAAAVLDISAHQHKNFVEASIPVHRTLYHSRRLVEKGFKVGVVKQTDTMAMRAHPIKPGTQRKPLERCVTEIYTRATIPLPECDEICENAKNDSTSARFILAIVEKTIHSKAIFAEFVHNMEDERKQDQTLIQQVHIGVFAHDVHTGRSLFEDFHDDGFRKHLQNILDLIEPVEFVIPVGGLSVYTTQVLKNYVTRQTRSGDYDCDDEDFHTSIRTELLANNFFEPDEAKRTLTHIFDCAKLEYHGITERPILPALSLCCFGGLWGYLRSLGLENTLISRLYSRIMAPTSSEIRHFRLPTQSRQDLDLLINTTTNQITGSLFSMLNYTKTEFGARKIREWICEPLTSIQQIRERQHTIQSLAFTSPSAVGQQNPTPSYHVVFEDLVDTILPKCKPLLRILQQIHTRRASPARTIYALESLLDVESHIGNLIEILRAEDRDNTKASTRNSPVLLGRLLNLYPKMIDQLHCCLQGIDTQCARQNDMEKAIQRRLCSLPSLKQKYCELSDELQTLEFEYEKVLASCQQILHDLSLNYSTFRSGTDNEICHLIEVNRERLHDVPQEWLIVNSNKMIVRFHPRKIIQLHVREELLQQKKLVLVQSAWVDFLRYVDGSIYVTAMQCVDILATLDALCSLATVAQTQPNYNIPEFVSDDIEDQMLEITDGRHPIVETLLDKSCYISNSVSLMSSKASPGVLLMISGPNAGGKSSFLRMCALIVIMAQMGSFVPAKSVRLSVFDGVYTRMHRNNENTNVQWSEVKALSTISHHATSKSLVLIDEIGYGLATTHAHAIANGLLVFLVEKTGCHVLFVSHMSDLIRKVQNRLRQKCQTKEFGYEFNASEPYAQVQSRLTENDELIFHYALNEGIASDSFAIDVAMKTGIPRNILQHAVRQLKMSKTKETKP